MIIRTLKQAKKYDKKLGDEILLPNSDRKNENTKKKKQTKKYKTKDKYKESEE